MHYLYFPTRDIVMYTRGEGGAERNVGMEDKYVLPRVRSLTLSRRCSILPSLAEITARVVCFPPSSFHSQVL